MRRLVITGLSSALAFVAAAGPAAAGPTASPPLRVLVFTKTTGYRHASIPAAVAAVQTLAAARRVHRRRNRGRRRVHGSEPRPLRGRALPPHLRRRPGRRPAGGLRALHPRRRRLRRRPLGGRHRVRLAVVRRPGRRLLQEPPGDPAGLARRRRRPAHRRPAAPLDADRRVVRLPDAAARRRRPRHDRRDDLRPGPGRDGSRASDHVGARLRRRPRVVHGNGAHR